MKILDSVRKHIVMKRVIPQILGLNPDAKILNNPRFLKKGGIWPGTIKMDYTQTFELPQSCTIIMEPEKDCLICWKGEPILKMKKEEDLSS